MMVLSFLSKYLWTLARSIVAQRYLMVYLATLSIFYHREFRVEIREVMKKLMRMAYAVQMPFDSFLALPPAWLSVVAEEVQAIKKEEEAALKEVERKMESLPSRYHLGV